MEVPSDLLNYYRSSYVEGQQGSIASRAPGRIEILGNHTDYNGGRVLNATIDRFVWAIGYPTDNIDLHSMNYEESITFNPEVSQPPFQLSWGDYVRGLYWAFDRRRHRVRGFTGVVYGDVPIGAGLSSSAAFEVSLANLIARISDLRIHPKAIAMIAFESERLFCGVSCGIQDQFASNLCKPNSILGIHAATMQTMNVPLPKEAAFITIDSMIQRQSAEILNRRRDECQQALAILREIGFDISNICALNQDDLLAIEGRMHDVLFRRVKHLVEEHARVVYAIDALNAGRIGVFGNLLNESHASSSNLYEVSHRNLDLLTEILQNQGNVFGARLTGAGLGGSVIACVPAGNAEAILHQTKQEYAEQTGINPNGMIVRIPGGAATWEI